MDEKMTIHVTADTSAEDQYAQAIAQLLDITKVNLLIGQLANLFLQQNKKSISDGSPDADPEALKQTLQYFEDEFAKETPALQAVVIDLYKNTFSFEQVQAVLAFYGSEAGQKFLQGGAMIEQQLQGVAQSWAKESGKLAFDRAAAKVNGE